MHHRVEVGTGSTLAAMVLALRFSQSWRSRVMKALVSGAENPAKETADAMRSRLDTIAITESARRFNETRDQIASTIQVPTGKILVKRWDAMLDACQYCALEHGTVVLANESFPGGNPGTVHARCQCVAHYFAVNAFEFYALA